MNSQICKCCGQPVAQMGDALPRNPNVCVACSDVADSIAETVPAEVQESARAEATNRGEAGPTAFAM